MARHLYLGVFMWQSARNDRLFLVLLAVLIGLAWVSLLAWGQSPYSRFLDHEALTDITGEDVRLLVFFVAAWTLMIFAMMLPTTMPLIALFRTITSERPNHLTLVGLLAAGYLAVWMAFGVLVHVADLGVHEASEKIPWLDTNGWVIGAGTLMLAGVYQFTPLKYHCLDKCRSPFSFINSRWNGGNEPAQSFRIGLDHGLFCLGCCWTLMLLMFGVGAGNIGWMLLLGGVMGVGKNMPWGRRLSTPLGITLIGSAALVTLVHYLRPLAYSSPRVLSIAPELRGVNHMDTA